MAAAWAAATGAGWAGAAVGRATGAAVSSVVVSVLDSSLASSLTGVAAGAVSLAGDGGGERAKWYRRVQKNTRTAVSGRAFSLHIAEGRERASGEQATSHSRVATRTLKGHGASWTGKKVFMWTRRQHRQSFSLSRSGRATSSLAYRAAGSLSGCPGDGGNH